MRSKLSCRPARSSNLCCRPALQPLIRSLSQPYLMPLENNSTFVGMMEDAMHNAPAALKNGESSQACIVPASAPIHEIPQGMNLVTRASLRANLDTDKGSSRGMKRTRAAAVTWDEKSTNTLLKVYEEQWTLIKKGNLRTKDWEDLTYALNREINGSFNLEHARNRIDTLKKTYKKELYRANSTGSTPSTWPLFDICASLWGKMPKCTENAGALENDGLRDSLVALETPIDLDGLEGGSTSQNPQVDTAEQVDLDGEQKKKVKQVKRSSLGAVARTMGNGMKEMRVAYERAEEKKTAMLRELELSRMAHEERLVRIKEEEETKRHQMFFATQLEIAKLLAKRQE